MTNSKKVEKNAKKEKELTIFEKEIMRLPKDLKDKLLSHQAKIQEVVDVINKKSKQSIGVYVTPEIKFQDNKPIPNFDNLIVNFLFDDYEKPIPQFNAKFFFENEFDKLLVEEIKKDEHGQDYAQYHLKKDKNIKFVGTSISILRENCFDAIYDDLKTLGSSFVYEDNRGFISALKSIDIHRNMLLQKFEKYVVVYAGAGSWLRGEKSNDFDIFVVVDDTDVKRMPRAQVKDQLTRIVWQMAQEVAQLTGIQLHAQVYLLTDFWDHLKDAHPVMFTFLRDGVPFYDRGIFSAWKELLKLGKIRPSAEAIDMHMNVGTQLIDRAKKMFNEIVMNDIYYSVLNPSQAILMLKGYNPTTPKETIKMFKEVLLAKEKSVTKKDVDILESVIGLFKKIEHNREYEVKGKDVDKLIVDAEYYLKKIKTMFEEITAEKTKESIVSSYVELVSQLQTLPGLAEIDGDELFKKFDKDFVKTGKMSGFVKDAIKSMVKARGDFDKGTLTITEVNKTLKEIRNVYSEIRDFKNKQMANDYGRKRLIFNYDENKLAEIVKYDSKMFLIDLANSKSFDIDVKTGKAKEIKFDESSFSDVGKFESIVLDENLIGVAKKVLGVKEIFL